MDDDANVERQNRVLLRPWLENMLETESILGLEWFDAEKTMFKVPWKHRSKKDWSMRHSSVFLEWAKNTGRWSEGDPAPNFAQLKTRLRCAFNKAPDIDEMKEHHCNKGEEPFKVYRFNTRRGDVKSVFGRKICPKTTYRQQGHRSGSPMVLKFESCEEEIVDDDAIYGEIKIHSSTFSSGESTSGFGKNEMGKMEMDENGYSPTVSGGDWTYERYVPHCESRDSKSPVIPLTVEMMTSSSPNDDSDCDGESPKNFWQIPADESLSVSRVLQTTVKSEFLSGNIHQIKAKEIQKPVSDDSADKMHLLQMASLFVEAAERKKEKEIQRDEYTPEPIVVSVNSTLSKYPPNHYMIIMPSHCEIENQNEGSVTSGYVTPTSTDVIDVKLPLEEEPTGSNMMPDLNDLTEEEEETVSLTKSPMQTKDPATSDEQRQLNCRIVGQIQPISCHGNRNIKAARIHLPVHNTCDDTTFDTLSTNVDMLMPLSEEQVTMDQIKQYLKELSERSRQQREWQDHLRSWENRLRSWEIQLQAKEETLYWRDRCLQSELGINSRPTQNCHLSKDLNVSSSNLSSLTSASWKQSLQLKDLLTLTSSAACSSICSSAVVSTGVLSGGDVNKELMPRPVIAKERSESQLNRLCIPGNKHVGGQVHSLNQVIKSFCPNIVKENSGKLDGDHVILSNSLSLGNTGSSNDYMHPVSVMSLIASNQGVPLIVPVLSGSQPIMFVPQHLVPVAPIQSVNSDAGILLRNCLENQLTAKVTNTNSEFVKVLSEKVSLLNVVNGLEAKKCSSGSKATILLALNDFEKSVHSNEGSSCSQVSSLDSQILESTLEKSKALVVNLEKEADHKNKATAVSDADSNYQNMNSEENSDFQHLDSKIPESTNALHTDSYDISFPRNAQLVSKSKGNGTPLSGSVAPSDRLNVPKNCQSIGTFPTESEPRVVVFPNAIPKIVVSFPQINLSVAGVQATSSFSKSVATDFTNWLRTKTEIICKEEILEGKKYIENTEDQTQQGSKRNERHCSLKSELKIQTMNQEDSANQLQYDQNLMSISDTYVLEASSPILTPQVPLVVENEKVNFGKDSIKEGFVSKSSPCSSRNLVKRRKPSFEKQNSFKKVRVDS